MTDLRITACLLACLGACAGASTATDGETDQPPSPFEGSLWLNEIMAVNDGTIADEQGQFDDWFELYNAAGEAVDLTGFQVTDDLEGKVPFELGGGQVEAGGFTLVWADDEPAQGDLHVAFKLSGGGETLSLLDPEGLLVDEVEFGVQAADVSYARVPDGGATWQEGPPTPGASNE